MVAGAGRFCWLAAAEAEYGGSFLEIALGNNLDQGELGTVRKTPDDEGGLILRELEPIPAAPTETQR